jgi:hypothetical protein
VAVLSRAKEDFQIVKDAHDEAIDKSPPGSPLRMLRQGITFDFRDTETISVTDWGMASALLSIRCARRTSLARRRREASGAILSFMHCLASLSA